jgi:hypothetical protein
MQTEEKCGQVQNFPLAIKRPRENSVAPRKGAKLVEKAGLRRAIEAFDRERRGRSLGGILVSTPEIEGTSRSGGFMSCQRKIYSRGGESWWLCRAHDGQVFVLHEANDRSGRQTTRIEIGDFLKAGYAGPEHQSLLRLIGGLAEMTAADVESNDQWHL